MFLVLTGIDCNRPESTCEVAQSDISVRSSLDFETAGVGFEPTSPVKSQRLSRPPRSTAPAPRRSAL